jgi:hypothetical protein
MGSARCATQISIKRRKRKGQAKRVTTAVTSEQKSKMAALFEAAMGEHPPDPEMDRLGRRAPGELTQEDKSKLQKLLTEWMNAMQEGARKAFDEATADKGKKPRQQKVNMR